MRVVLAAFVLLLLSPAAAHAVCGMPDNPQWTQQRAYDPVLLEQTYECVKARYDPAAHMDYKTDFVLPLEYAGVEVLLGNNGDLSETERAHILNDFGFWLQKEGDVDYAIRVLREVVRLEPQRGLAWLNLGDEYVAAVTGPGVTPCCVFNVPSADITSLTSQASTAYQNYVSLTPTPDSHATAFLVRHPYNPANDAVCRYIADHANAGDLYGLFLPQGAQVSLVGQSGRFYIYTVARRQEGIAVLAYRTPQPRLAAHEIFAEDAPPGGISLDYSPLSNPDDDLEGGPRRIWIISYGGGVAILSDIDDLRDGMAEDSMRAVLPGRNVVCNVDPADELQLTVAQNAKLCAAFREGSAFRVPPVDPSLAGHNIALATGLGGTYLLTDTTRADLRNDGHALDMAYFTFVLGPPGGAPIAQDCAVTGVVVYDPKTRRAVSSDLNSALEMLPPSCPVRAYRLFMWRGESRIERGIPGQDGVPATGVYTRLIIWQGKTYIETGVPGQNDVSATGVYVVKRNDIVPVCLMGADWHYSVD